MSCFLVSIHHIDTIVHAALPTPDATLYIHHKSLTQGESKGFHVYSYADRDELGRILLRANMDSMKARYGDPVDEDEINAYRFRIPADCSTLGAIKAIQSLMYQACETKTWYHSLPWTICIELIDDLTRKLPGYDQPDTWSIEDEGRPNIVSLYDLATGR